MSLSFTVNITGSPEGGDREAAEYAIDKYNEFLAAQETPGTPLPKGTLQEVAASYETVLADKAVRLHEVHAAAAAKQKLDTQNVKQLWDGATDAQRAAAVAALGG